MTARILIADDNADIRRLIDAVLRVEGFELEMVEDGSKAIERIQTEHFDAILLDLMMPVLSGPDVLEWIEANRPDVGRGCVIILTAAIRELSEIDASKVFAVIPKPFDIEHLRATVRDCVIAKKTSP